MKLGTLVQIRKLRRVRLENKGCSDNAISYNYKYGKVIEILYKKDSIMYRIMVSQSKKFIVVYNNEVSIVSREDRVCRPRNSPELE